MSNGHRRPDELVVRYDPLNNRLYRNCLGCGQWLDIHEFGRAGLYVKSRCRKCRAADARRERGQKVVKDCIAITTTG